MEVFQLIQTVAPVAGVGIGLAQLTGSVTAYWSRRVGARAYCSVLVALHSCRTL
ncbi:hypothetical protein [Paenibacillus sp. Soil766]|uniref:hypothetical protein n=1 Tax=Paenibacillus sp. Soil766 TaxID=1736404 RepID=UPI001F3AB1F9|nr:hypothetical protein [Paenibacillus sp. Soil766]